MYVSLQPYGITWSDIHGRVAVRKVNLASSGLECMGSFYWVKNTNVNKIGSYNPWALMNRDIR